jgi:hypothetical protein
LDELGVRIKIIQGCTLLLVLPNRGHIAGESHEPTCAE